MIICPDSSKAFLSALCALPTESFDRLWAGVLDASTPFNPNTPHVADLRSTLTDLHSRGTIGTTGDKAHIWEAKLERFIANAVGALIQLVDRHWEPLAAGLVREFRGDPSCGNKHMRVSTTTSSCGSFEAGCGGPWPWSGISATSRNIWKRMATLFRKIDRVKPS